MAKPTQLPRWATGAGAKVTPEPTEGKKDLGWVSAEKPPESYFNWLLKTIYLWAVYLDGLTNEALTWAAAHTFAAKATFSAGLASNVAPTAAADVVRKTELDAEATARAAADSTEATNRSAGDAATLASAQAFVTGRVGYLATSRSAGTGGGGLATVNNTPSDWRADAVLNATMPAANCGGCFTNTLGQIHTTSAAGIFRVEISGRFRSIASLVDLAMSLWVNGVVSVRGSSYLVPTAGAAEVGGKVSAVFVVALAANDTVQPGFSNQAQSGVRTFDCFSTEMVVTRIG